MDKYENLNYEEIRIIREELVKSLEEYNCEEHIYLPVSPRLLDKILLKEQIIHDRVAKVFAIDFKLAKKLDLTDLSFDNVYIAGLDFTGSKGVVINPIQVFDKNFSRTILTDVTFKGYPYTEFENCNIVEADFTGSHEAHIDPSEVKNKDLTGTILTDTTISGSFYGVNIQTTNFAGSIGAVIDPETVRNRSLYGTVLTDTIIRISSLHDEFDNCDIRFTNFTGATSSDVEEGIVINPQTVRDKYLQGTVLSGVEFDGSFDNCHISGANFKGSKGAVINPETVFNKDLYDTVLTDAQVVEPVNMNKYFHTDFTGCKFIEPSAETYEVIDLVKKALVKKR